MLNRGSFSKLRVGNSSKSKLSRIEIRYFIETFFVSKIVLGVQ